MVTGKAVARLYAWKWDSYEQLQTHIHIWRITGFVKVLLLTQPRIWTIMSFVKV